MEQPDMYAQLRVLVRRYLGDELSYFQLRHILQSYGQRSSSDHDRVWSMVMTHLALFGAGDWTEQELKASLHEIEDAEERREPIYFTSMLKDPRFLEMINSGVVPWPMRVGARPLPSTESDECKEL